MTTATGENPLIDQSIDKLKEIDDKVVTLGGTWSATDTSALSQSSDWGVQ
jgi:hypothetical protein